MTDRPIVRQTNRHTYIQTDRQTDRQTDFISLILLNTSSSSSIDHDIRTIFFRIVCSDMM